MERNCNLLFSCYLFNLYLQHYFLLLSFLFRLCCCGVWLLWLRFLLFCMFQLRNLLPSSKRQAPAIPPVKNNVVSSCDLVNTTLCFCVKELSHLHINIVNTFLNARTGQCCSCLILTQFILFPSKNITVFFLLNIFIIFFRRKLSLLFLIFFV